MKKDRLLKAAALGAALITCLSGFTSRPVTQNKSVSYTHLTLPTN
mgnify:CR=1 FL=1